MLCVINSMNSKCIDKLLHDVHEVIRFTTEQEINDNKEIKCIGTEYVACYCVASIFGICDELWLWYTYATSLIWILISLRQI